MEAGMRVALTHICYFKGQEGWEKITENFVLYLQ